VTEIEATQIRQEKASDAAAREALLDAAYGPIRLTKPSQRLRGGRAPARGHRAAAATAW